MAYSVTLVQGSDRRETLTMADTAPGGATPQNPHDPQTELLARHRAVIPHWVALNYDQPIEIVSGSGNRVTDGAGNGYLDFFAGILTNMIGYNVPEVREAVERQLATGVVHTSTLYLLRGQIELAEKIAKLSGIPDAKVFFTNSGTEANETALLIATYSRKSDQVLALRQSYHGRSFGAVGVTAIRSWKNVSHSPLNVHFLHGADRQLPQFARLSEADYVAACVEDLRHVIATATAGDVACLIAEPVQGVGGFTMPPDGLFAAYKAVLDEHGILLVSDEVQTGWGRTGQSFWGIQNHGVVPDAMTFAKGLGNGFAVGGVVARGDLLDAPHAAGISTFGGNPIAMAAANATLDYVLDHELQANAARTGALIIAGLHEAAGRLTIVGDVRGKGLMFAVELVDPATGERSPALAARMMEETRRRGLLCGKGGLYGNVIRMAPPLTLTEAEAKEGLGILIDALEALEATDGTNREASTT
jgi:4-aminobutyrate aminotransferase